MRGLHHYHSKGNHNDGKANGNEWSSQVVVRTTLKFKHKSFEDRTGHDMISAVSQKLLTKISPPSTDDRTGYPRNRRQCRTEAKAEEMSKTFFLSEHGMEYNKTQCRRNSNRVSNSCCANT